MLPSAIRLPSAAAALLGLWIVTACGGGPGEPVGPPTAAVATRSCAPTDGPAVAITLASSLEAAQARRPPYVAVSIWQGPNALAGRTWVLADGREGGAGRQLTAVADYEVATRGTVRVQRVAADTTIEGTVDLVFPGGARVRQTFRAAWRSTPHQPLCG